jgi:GPH family glycoside/pentoside/hexuronide:cation symporter
VTANNVASEKTVALSTKLYYGFGSIAYGVKNNGFSYLLLFFYVQVVGLEGYLAGLGMLVVMVCDAISDPVVGHISDNWHSRWGRRHPFMYFAALPVSVSYFFLWNPPELSQTAMLFYFIVLAVLVRTLITMYEIPSTSLVAEFTDDYDQRTSMLSFRSFFGWWGGLTIAVLGYKVFFSPTDEYSNGLLNPDRWPVYGGFAACIIFIAIMVSALGTHKLIPQLKQPPASHKFSLKQTFSELIESLSNRNFLIIFASAVIAAMAGGVNTSLVIYFNTYFWELTPDQIGNLNLVYYFSAVFALFVTPRVTANRSKQTVAIRVWLTGALLLPLPVILRLIGFFPDNDSGWILPLLMIHGFLDVAILIMAGILISSMIADIVEDSQKETGRRSEGLFFAGQTFASKVVHGFGMFATGIILSAINFPKDASPGEVPVETLQQLGYIYVPLIIVFYSLAVLCLTRYKITRESHAENLAIVDAKPIPAD